MRLLASAVLMSATDISDSAWLSGGRTAPELRPELKPTKPKPKLKPEPEPEPEREGEPEAAASALNLSTEVRAAVRAGGCVRPASPSSPSGWSTAA